MGASALLALAVAGSYGALAAVALTSVDLGAVINFPGRAVEAVISVHAAPQTTSQYPGARPTGGGGGGGSAAATGGGARAGSHPSGGAGARGNG